MQRIDAARLARQPEQALALIATATPALQDNPAMRLRKAQIALDLGRIEPARAELEALIAHLPSETDPDLSANARRSLCIALSQLGRTDEALKACDGSIRLLEGRGTPSALARTYNNRGIVTNYVIPNTKPDPGVVYTNTLVFSDATGWSGAK